MCAAQCEASLLFSHGNDPLALEPKNFSEAPMVYFCSPLLCVSAWPNRLNPAWLCAAHGAVQEGPVTPDGSLVSASERVWRPGCWPTTTTSDRQKPQALRNQHKAPFQGPSPLFLPLLSAQPGAGYLMEPGRECIHSKNGLKFNLQIHMFPTVANV